ncbi:MAG: hypothetical protein V1787_00015 [Candidatus Micrarchaeota archaeon]
MRNDRRRLYGMYAFAFVLLVASLTVLPYASAPGLPASDLVYDTPAHAYRLWFVKQELAGRFSLPLWTSDWYGGMPFLELYPPLSAFALSWIGLFFDPAAAIRIALALAHILSVAAFYFLALRLFKGDLKLVAGSCMLFAVFPYLLFEVYPRGGLAEAALVAIAPAAFLAYEKAVAFGGLKWRATFGLAIGLGLLSHTVMGAVLAFCIILLAALDWSRIPKQVLALAPFFALGVLAVSFNAVSAVGLLPEIRFDAATAPPFVPMDIAPLAQREYQNPMYLGWLASAGFVLGLFALRNDAFGVRKYGMLAVALLAAGFSLHLYAPQIVLASVQFAFRLFCLFSVPFCLVAATGFKHAAGRADAVARGFKAFKGLRLSGIIFFGLAAAAAVDFSAFLPVGDAEGIPPGLLHAYAGLSEEPGFFRVSDQNFLPFGVSPVFHSHAVVGGGLFEGGQKLSFGVMASLSEKVGRGTGQEANASLRLLGMASVKYVAVDFRFVLPALTEKECGRGYCLYENKFFQHHVRLVSSVAAVSPRLKEGRFKDLLLNRILAAGAAEKTPVFSEAPLPDYGTEPGAVVHVFDERPGYFRLRVDGIPAGEKRYLVISESYFSGWNARLDGTVVPILEGVPAMMAIPVSNGELFLEYGLGMAPAAALAVTLLSLAVLAGALVLGLMRRK